MLDRVSQEELLHWVVLQQMDPVGPAREDLQHAIGTAAFVNTQLTKTKDAKKPLDYLAGEWLRKGYDRAAVKSGRRKPFEGKTFWTRFRKIINKEQ